MSARTLTQNPFSVALSNTFINAKGEVSNNLDTSKSKVAEQLRKERDYKERRGVFLRETRDMRKKIVYLRQQVEESRKAGMKLVGEARVEMFKLAAYADQQVKMLQKEIARLAKEYQVR